MSTLSASKASTLHELRVRLEALPGIERVLIDDERDGIWVIGDPTQERPVLEMEIRGVLSRLGIEPDAVPVELTMRSNSERNRVRFVGVAREMLPDGSVMMRVSLEWQGEVFVGEEVGESGGPIEMRTAAVAAVNAVEALTSVDLGLRLIGIKQIRAFDQEITVTSMLRSGQPPQRLVGAVLASRDPARTAALAVLNGLNRVLGNFLSTNG